MDNFDLMDDESDVTESYRSEKRTNTLKRDADSILGNKLYDHNRKAYWTSDSQYTSRDKSSSYSKKLHKQVGKDVDNFMASRKHDKALAGLLSAIGSIAVIKGGVDTIASDNKFAAAATVIAGGASIISGFVKMSKANDPRAIEKDIDTLNNLENSINDALEHLQEETIDDNVGMVSGRKSDNGAERRSRSRQIRRKSLSQLQNKVISAKRELIREYDKKMSKEGYRYSSNDNAYSKYADAINNNMYGQYESFDVDDDDYQKYTQLAEAFVDKYETIDKGDFDLMDDKIVTESKSDRAKINSVYRNISSSSDIAGYSLTRKDKTNVNRAINNMVGDREHGKKISALMTALGIISSSAGSVSMAAGGNKLQSALAIIAGGSSIIAGFVKNSKSKDIKDIDRDIATLQNLKHEITVSMLSMDDTSELAGHYEGSKFENYVKNAKANKKKMKTLYDNVDTALTRLTEYRNKLEERESKASGVDESMDMESLIDDFSLFDDVTESSLDEFSLMDDCFDGTPVTERRKVRPGDIARKLDNVMQNRDDLANASNITDQKNARETIGKLSSSSELKKKIAKAAAAIGGIATAGGILGIVASDNKLAALTTAVTGAGVAAQSISKLSDYKKFDTRELLASERSLVELKQRVVDAKTAVNKNFDRRLDKNRGKSSVELHNEQQSFNKEKTKAATMLRSLNSLEHDIDKALANIEKQKRRRGIIRESMDIELTDDIVDVVESIDVEEVNSDMVDNSIVEESDDIMTFDNSNFVDPLMEDADLLLLYGEHYPILLESNEYREDLVLEYSNDDGSGMSQDQKDVRTYNQNNTVGKKAEDKAEAEKEDIEDSKKFNRTLQAFTAAAAAVAGGAVTAAVQGKGQNKVADLVALGGTLATLAGGASTVLHDKFRLSDKKKESLEKLDKDLNEIESKINMAGPSEKRQLLAARDAIKKARQRVATI